jgi:2-keto-4-pentenoate hydratase/2-oxohepta-3-ene-1,7-dioic acid hydratase in catechol pathway
MVKNMRITRFTNGGQATHARVEGAPGEEVLVVLSGDPMYEIAEPTGERIPLDDEVRLLAPVIPRSKVICMGKNYESHAKEVPSRGPDSDVPIVFLKPNTAVIGPDDPIVLPPYSEDVQLEAELAVIIGRTAKDISAEDAHHYIYGYTCANDVTARDLQHREDQWFRAKSFDSSLPLGPWIETELDVSALGIGSRINGVSAQHGNTGDMIHGVAESVAMVSEVVTLLPGDVLLTGTPSGVRRLAHGDIVEIEIEGIGTLRNPVIQR